MWRGNSVCRFGTGQGAGWLAGPIVLEYTGGLPVGRNVALEVHFSLSRRESARRFAPNDTSFSCSPMPIISTRNLRKQFGTGDVAVDVLRGVDLAIESGEFVALMGPSGSGKSTLLSILGGIEPPTSGEVILDGVDIANLSDDERTLLRRRKIGFVFQAFNLIPTLTALENVSLPLELDGVDAKEAKRRALESLERVELGHRADHIPSKMSGGEQQRVAVARALAIQPAILLADEPTGNLDSRQSARVTALLRSLAADHKQTIIMVTHDANVAKSAFRLLMFRDGNIERDLSQAEFAASFPAIPSPTGSGSTSHASQSSASDAILSEGNR